MLNATSAGGAITCAIVGIGPQEPRLRELIGELGVGDRVRLLGRRSDVPDFIRTLDAAVMCSTREGAPLALLEYMAGGAPIVASAVGGIPEILKDGVSGLLVEPSDPPALAGALQRILDDRELARALGEAARARQRSEYDLNVVVARLEDLYERCYARVTGRTTGRFA